MKLKTFAILPLLLLTACSMQQGPTVATTQTRPAAKAVAALDTIPSLLQVAGWLAQYGKEVVEVSESPTWEASYPLAGSNVDHFIWQAETMTDAVDYTDPTGLFASLRILTPAASQGSFRVRLCAVDSLGNVGDWSGWGTFNGSDGGPQLKE